MVVGLLSQTTTLQRVNSSCSVKLLVERFSDIVLRVIRSELEFFSSRRPEVSMFKLTLRAETLEDKVVVKKGERAARQQLSY
jgi:hypothetical protein